MQSNQHAHCNHWFDYKTPCTDATCDEVLYPPYGRTRLPLSAEGKRQAAAAGIPATPASLCSIKDNAKNAPYAGKGALFQGWYYDVKTVCKQICDYCAPTTPSTTTSTTTTADNRRKYHESKIFETFLLGVVYIYIMGLY